MQKKFTIAVIALCLCMCCLIGVTVAWLTDTSEEVKNTFTVGDIQITLDETKVDLYGDKDTTVTDRVIANTYKLLPGHNYLKDPIIHVQKGSEVCYLFVKITNDIAAIEAGTTVAEQMEENGWTNLGNGVYGKADTVDARTAAQDVPLFEEFTISDSANVADYDNKAITVKACAIQADGFDDMEDAWTNGLNSTFPNT